MKRIFTFLLVLCVIISMPMMGVFATEEATWQAETTVPISAQFCSSVSIGGKIYMVTEDDQILDKNTVYIYDIELKLWSEGKKRSTKRFYSSVCAVGTKIYAIGGKSGSTLQNTVEIYDTVLDTWSTGANMPIGTNGFSCTAVGSNVYAIG